MPDALCQQKDSSAPPTPKSDLALHLADVLLGTREPSWPLRSLAPHLSRFPRSRSNHISVPTRRLHPLHSLSVSWPRCRGRWWSTMPARASAPGCPGPARRPPPPALALDCLPLDRHSFSLSVSLEDPKGRTVGGAKQGLANCGVEEGADDCPTLS